MSWGSCNGASNNIHFDFPPIMNDGRNFATWQPGAVINNTIREKLRIKAELFFLNTPKINKNIIDNEMKISGIINCKFSIMVYKVSLNYKFQSGYSPKLQLY